MATQSAAGRVPECVDSDRGLLPLLGSLTFAVLGELGVSRFSKLLDAIAENEALHEITMID